MKDSEILSPTQSNYSSKLSFDTMQDGESLNSSRLTFGSPNNNLAFSFSQNTRSDSIIKDANIV